MNWNETLHCRNGILPDDIARLKAAGFYREATERINRRLAGLWAPTGGLAENDPMPEMPEAMRSCLLAQKEIMCRIAADYPYTLRQAVRRVQEHIPNFTEIEFRKMEADGDIDWRYIEGEKHYFRRFYESLLYTDASIGTRAGKAKSGTQERRRDIARRMRANGSLSAQITLRYTIRPTEAAFADARLRAALAGHRGVQAKVWLPMPAACPAQSNIELTDCPEPPTSVAPQDAPQRTVFWERELAENMPFTIEYRYTETAVYTDPMSTEITHPAVEFLPPEAGLGEEKPHIEFTPYLRALTNQLTQNAVTDAEKAKRIYDFITLHVKYQYQPSYFILDSIADGCARNCRGDCGVQALTFITMCRIAGIPALWQSGLMVGPDDAGCHDWAMFYLNGKGWMYADCSFGGSAARVGDEELRRHYFGNLDPYRMTANRAFEAPLYPPKEGWRADPCDNQTGEIELESIGLTGKDYDTQIELVKLELL